MVRFGVHLFLWTESFSEPAIRLIDTQRTKRELKRHDMGCLGSVGLSTEHDLTSSNEETRRGGIEWMKRCVEVTSELGGDAINGVVYTAWGKITGKSRTETEWQHSVEALREICQYARDYGVTLGLEPVNRFETYFLNTAADAVRLAKDVAEPNVKVHLDTFHMNIEEKDFYQPIKDVGHLLWHMHCCENDRGVPGTGHVDWDGVFQALSEVGYDRWLVIESFTPEMEKMAASTAIWRKIAPSADAIASQGLKFLKGKAAEYFGK